MKAVFVINLLLTLAAVALGWMNRSKFIAARKDKDTSNRAIIANFEKVDAQNKIATDLIAKNLDERKKFEADKFETESENKTIAQKEGQTKEVVAEAEKTQKEIDEVNGRIAKMLENFGGRPEELPAKRDALKAEIDAQLQKVAVLEKEIEVTNGVVAENQKTIGRFSEQQTQRTKSIALSQRQGVVNAVNPDWAFCIVNMGKADGVSTDSRLLVKRGTELVGKLNIIQIENNLTVADIDPKSVKAGNGILPGDQVIFDNAN
jgi:hypothetical protein